MSKSTHLVQLSSHRFPFSFRRVQGQVALQELRNSTTLYVQVRLNTQGSLLVSCIPNLCNCNFFTCLAKATFCGLHFDLHAVQTGMKRSIGYYSTLSTYILKSVPFALSCERQQRAEFIDAN